MLEVNNLGYRLKNGASLLEGIHFQAGPGELIALLGENGAGKSTLLQQLADGQQQAVRFDGKPLASWSLAELARRRAFLGQHPANPAAMTGAELVALGRAPFHETAAATQAACNLSLEACQALDLANRPLTALSGGQRARLHLARVLCQLQAVTRPLLLLDEPTAALDLAAQHQLLAQVSALVARGALVIWVVHDLNLACQYASRLLLLKGGLLLADLAPNELSPSLASRLYNHPMHCHRLGTPPYAFWQAQLGVP
ncbi:ABC transporter ATP-binding protein [Gallaecimonas xiamenensis]|uniref:Hemin importer ATP-binding subunit n=1 Tax=Gallaecimonas xiamenensis 3-C-1 TaxID=745411 RepID=K2J4P5_9GAMM|nr:ATP-binding cassette domain-containing protein [Gallaecimonas xiamenensis]EKE69872.1 hemin importer ATP-binding subunit [Gallaecimonas xiamenensis 3-C-1]